MQNLQGPQVFRDHPPTLAYMSISLLRTVKLTLNFRQESKMSWGTEHQELLIENQAVPTWNIN